MKPRRPRSVMLAILVLVMLAPVVVLSAPPAPSRPAVLSRGGLAGSGPTMQPVNLPARVARMAAVPGTREAWAIGLSSAVVTGWDTRAPGGQVVFLHYTPRGGWSMDGPPRDLNGHVVNPTLTALAFASNGEGWAVGDEGVLMRYTKSTGWRLQPTQLTEETLQSVSLTVDQGRTVGYAVGDNATILRLSGDIWNRDTGLSSVVEDLVSVSVLNAEVAWAVSGSSSTYVAIYQRSGGAWNRVPTQRAMFDNPPAPAGGGATNNSARGAAIAATTFGVWVTGAMVPSDASHPTGDETVGDNSRPFALWIDRSGEVVTYCPDQYSLGQYGEMNAARLCDRPFPLAPFDLASLTVFPGPNGGEVFAGGLGLFHYQGGGWFREPDVNGYLVSLAMFDPREGWTATSGNTYGAGGAVHSSTTVVGHWTAEPETPRVARWAQPNRDVLEAVTFDPSGAYALAVGQRGQSVVRTPDDVWDSAYVGTTEPIHGVAWPGADAWAVGGHGTIARYRDGRWRLDEASESVTRQALFDVAFRTPSDGVAVGTNGVILRYDGSRWSRDPASGRVATRSLYAVAAVGDAFVAVGQDGLVLVRREGLWRAITGLEPYLRRGARAPSDLYAVEPLGDGRVVVGGANAALLVGTPDALRPFAQPLEGTVLAIAGRAVSGGKLRLVASVSEEQEKYLGDRLSASSAALIAFDGSQWRDVQLASRRTVYSTYEPAALQDPPLAVAMDPVGFRAWSVGGISPNALSPGGQIQSDPTSSIYRFDALSDPTQPATRTYPELPAGGTSFAFFGESGCLLALCSATTGTGIKGDVVAQQIQEEINTLAGLPGGPAFVAYGGNARRVGLPEEAAQFRGFLERFSVPAFSAIGDLDLYTAVTPPNVSGPAGGLVRSQYPSNNQFFLETFADAPAPWGTSGKGHPRIRPVNVAGSAEPTPGRARTHYAFDYMDGGSPKLRVVVLDSSQRSLGSNGQNPAEDQGTTWLPAVLADARIANIPSIVVLNQPTFNTTRGANTPNWPNVGDVAKFHAALITNGVSAVFASGIRVNLVYSASASGSPGSVPIFVSGAGGAPFEDTKVPLDGFYNAWYLVNVDPSVRTPPLGQSRVTVRAIPVLESLALHAEDGRVAPAGNTLQFTALGRAPTGGSSDLDHTHSTYLEYPRLATCVNVGLQNGGCASRQAVHADYRFVVEDPTIARFVQPALGRPGMPAEDGEGRLVADDQSGFLCTLRPGSTHVRIESGMRRARVPITVTGGAGPCIDKPIFDPKAPVVKARVERRPVPVDEVVLRRFRPPPQQTTLAIFPPPPAPVLAPAPPGAPGVGRKEEHEVQPDTEGQGPGHHGFSSLPRRRTEPVAATWPILGGLLIFSFMAALVTSSVQQRRTAVSRERWRS